MKIDKQIKEILKDEIIVKKYQKKGDGAVETIIVISIILLCFLGYFVIYNPIIKVKDGCWSWEREEVIEHFSLIDDYNMTCEQIKDELTLELYWIREKDEFKKEIIYTMCGDKILSEKVIVCGKNCFKEEYVERCLN